MTLAHLPGVRRLASRLGGIESDLVLFDSWGGRYSDNPRAISEALHRRGAGLRQVWVRKRSRAGREWSQSVVAGSRQHLALLGRAQFIVANNTLPGFFRKRTGTTFVQTWHGTPLKRIAFDMPRDGTRHQAKYLSHLAREVSEWDVLLSPNRFSTQVLRRAFRYEGIVLETGYPRNDVLSSDNADSIRDETRRRLGLAPDDFVVLYAPTFRQLDDSNLELDAARIVDALGPAAHVLVRAHHLVAPNVDDAHRRVLDVSASPDDVRELYLTADALITDYSSVMFDFAVTGKPILLFTYDLENYRDHLRGFYLDVEREAAGPLLRSTDEVIDALRDLPAVVRDWRPRYRRFRERFCALDDGGAADRVVDVVFAEIATPTQGPGADGTPGTRSHSKSRPSRS